MNKTTLSSSKIDYLRIILFIPIAWVAYKISMKLIVMISTKNLIETIGVNIWPYGIEFVQFLVFIISGTLVVPKVVRLLSGILALSVYVFAYFYSIYITPIILDVAIENDSFFDWSLFSYGIRFLTFVIVAIIIIYQYKKSVNREVSNQ
jgi:hypothetical protein